MSNNKQANKTIGFGLKNKHLGEYSGIFINVALDSISEKLLLDEEGNYDIDVLIKLLRHPDSELYQTGTKKDSEQDVDTIRQDLGL